MLCGAQSIFAPADGLRPIKRVVLQRGKLDCADIGGDNLKSRPAPMQNQKRSATPRSLDDPAKPGAQLFGVDRFQGGFHVQLKINLA
jgi:hypothetical protein